MAPESSDVNRARCIPDLRPHPATIAPMRLAIPVLLLAACSGSGDPAPEPGPSLAPSGPPVSSLLGIVHFPRRDPAEADFHARATRDGGLSWVRGEINWSRTEPERGRFEWNGVDHAVDQSRRDGKQVIALLAYGNRWATAEPPSDGSPNYPPDDVEDFGAFVYQVVTRYADRVRVWEVWNEQNGARFWQGTFQGDPARYGELLRAASRAARLADPEAVVLYGGLFYHAQGLTMAAPDFLDASHRAHPDLAEHYDGLAYHPYDLYPPRAAPEDDEAPHQSFETMAARLREVLAQHGAGDKELWATELGWPVYGHVTEEVQGAYLARAALLLAGLGVRSACWYTLWDGPDPDSFPPEDAFGLFRWQAESPAEREPEPKAAEEALRRLTTAVGDLGWTADRSDRPGVPDGHRALLFSDGEGRAVTAVWDPEGEGEPEYVEGDPYAE